MRFRPRLPELSFAIVPPHSSHKKPPENSCYSISASSVPRTILVIDFIRCGIIQFKLLPDLQCFPFAHVILFPSSHCSANCLDFMCVVMPFRSQWHERRREEKRRAEHFLPSLAASRLQPNLDCTLFGFLLKINYWPRRLRSGGRVINLLECSLIRFHFGSHRTGAQKKRKHDENIPFSANVSSRRMSVALHRRRSLLSPRRFVSCSARSLE